MKKIVLLVFILIATKAISQEHWEDNFWREEGKKRYAKTLTMAGLYTAFYDNGKIKWQGKCLENGTPDSVWVYFDKEGKKLWEGEYTGNYYEFQNVYDYDTEDKPTSTTDTSIIGHYKNGLKQGEWVKYDYNGKYIVKRGYYNNGEPTGIWQEFRVENIVTKVCKSSEYNYATQTRTFFNKDTIQTGTEQIDSLDYANRFGLKTNNYNHSNGEEAVKLNLCFLGTVQLINLDPLNNYFFKTGYQKLQGPIQSIGFEWSGIAENSFYWNYNLNWMPAVSADINDSIRLRLSGYSTTLALGGDLIKSDVIDIAPNLGFGFQQFKLKVLKTQNPDSLGYTFQEGDYRIYRKSAPTLTPMLNIRINMGNFSIGLAGGYVLDCSSQKWRYNGKHLKDSPKTSVSGLIANVSIGFHIPDY